MSETTLDYERMHRDLLRWFGQRGVRAQDAADLAQETLLRFARQLGTTGAPRNLKAWLAQAARSVFVDALRRRGRTHSSTDLDAMATPAADTDLSATVASWIEPMLNELDEPDRSILRLAELGGKSAREVAATLGMSPTAVGSRITRGRRKLEAKLLGCCSFEFDSAGRITGWRKTGSGPCTPDCTR